MSVERIVLDEMGQVVPETSPFVPPAVQPVQSNPDAARITQVTINGPQSSHSSQTTQYGSSADFIGRTAGILGTARTDFGAPVSGDGITENCIVEYAGMTMTVRGAQQAGLVKQVNGQWMETSSAERSAGSEQQPQASQAQAFDDATEHSLAQLVHAVPANAQMGVASKLIDGEPLSPGELSDLATMANMQPADFSKHLEATYVGFYTQANKTAQDSGATDPEAAWAWLRENRADALKNAMLEHVIQRNPNAYKSLIADYLANTTPDATAVKAGGVRIRQLPDGTRLVKLPGGVETSFEVAAKLGLI